jgi:hypothetical protein
MIGSGVQCGGDGQVDRVDGVVWSVDIAAAVAVDGVRVHARPSPTRVTHIARFTPHA